MEKDLRSRACDAFDTDLVAKDALVVKKQKLQIASGIWAKLRRARNSPALAPVASGKRAPGASAAIQLVSRAENRRPTSRTLQKLELSSAEILVQGDCIQIMDAERNLNRLFWSLARRMRFQNVRENGESVLAAGQIVFATIAKIAAATECAEERSFVLLRPNLFAAK